MKITMKYPRQYYEIVMKYPRHNNENRNEISKALLWKSQWNIPGIIMKIAMKYPRQYYEIVMKIPSANYYMIKAGKINEWNIQAKEWDVSLNL